MAGDLFEIISADSVQVYKYMDIGSGKPGRAERCRIRHYLIDWVEPDVNFTAGEFCREAQKAADEICARGRLPMIVGGTGLYIDSFFQGLSEIPEIPVNVKKSLRAELDERGLQYLYDELKRVDPRFGERIRPGDKQRVLRALEVYRGTGKPISSYYGHRTRYGSDNVLYVGLYEERNVITKRIEERVDRMISAGLVDEVISLRSRGYGHELKSMKSIGYAEINRHIDGEMALDEAVEKIKIVTKRFAKRQMTWFRKNGMFHWIKSTELDKIRVLLQRWLDGSFSDKKNTAR
jgi:tRNA dimethylallyltransferase